MNEVQIEIPKFITHIQTSKNNFVKISGQKIFSGINHHLRALIVRKLHIYIKKHIPSNIILPKPPLKISLDFYAPINYGNVKLLKTKDLSWKKPEPGYIPRWDADNQWIWGKCFNDTLTDLGLIPDDNVGIVKSSGEVNFIEVSSLEERKLVFKIKSV